MTVSWEYPLCGAQRCLCFWKLFQNILCLTLLCNNGCSVAEVFKGSIVAAALSHHSLSNGLWEAGTGRAVLHTGRDSVAGQRVRLVKCKMQCSLADLYTLQWFAASPNLLEGHSTSDPHTDSWFVSSFVGYSLAPAVSGVFLPQFFPILGKQFKTIKTFEVVVSQKLWL